MMPISVLGVLTIMDYGVCYYAYGVLIGPISADTRWPDAALGAIFSATLVITGAGGIAAGRVLDRRGPRPVFLLAGITGAGAMLVASGRFALTPKVLALGYAYLSSVRLTDIARPCMERLTDMLGIGTSLAALDGRDVVYVDRVQRGRAKLLVAMRPGRRRA